LSPMDKHTLVRIMTEPKNSIIKQYTELFRLDGVELVFEPDALSKIADLTIERKTGARGLRSIIEGVLKDIMFDTPSNKNIKKIIITEQTVDGGEYSIEYL
ncbi:MAG: ATP-dependent Clp protease ATP-binding subunit ClpX, partial [Clostridia bacterium]|nr:ATP-dependent Clp protease ATP-binding subunit ClpX [Clostridia bacterium]